ncbi:MAG: hypothetical protein QOK47_1315 [Actinomycetota bacterium]|jgi:hypothetical protein|nr:hypothetical protein [Actinomycetota bacterium]
MTSGEDDAVVSLHNEVTEPHVEPVTPPGRVHGLAIAGMAVCALIGIVAMFGFITINWPGTSSRYIVIAFIGAGVGFLACASTAMLTAARDTYARERSIPDNR